MNIAFLGVWALVGLVSYAILMITRSEGITKSDNLLQMLDPMSFNNYEPSKLVYSTIVAVLHGPLIAAFYIVFLNIHIIKYVKKLC